MKFDIILANPPFNIGEKMLIKWFDIANEICTVQPSTWLLGKKLKKDIVKHVDNWESTEIESILGSEHFDAAIGGVIAIQHFIKGKEETQKNSDYGKLITFDDKEYSKCEEISSYSNDELLVEFVKIIKPLYLNDNLDNHCKLANKILPSDGTNRLLERNPNDKWYCVKMPIFGGNKNVSRFYNNELKITDIKQYYEIYTSQLKLYFGFNTFIEAKNFYNYCKTYFARICLYISKTNLHIDKGEMKTVPWQDFTDSIFNDSPEDIDNALFKKYNISLDIIDHILELIPNYYNLDLSLYKQKGLITFDGKEYDKCEEITKFSNDELLVEFKNIVEPLYQTDNLDMHLKYIEGLTGHVLHKSFHEDKSPNENGWCVRVISFSPGAGSDGFYTLISKNGLNDYGQYKDMKNKTIIFGGKKKKFMEYYYMFNNKQDCINFINYIQTDFCRICLYLVKTNMHIIANGATKNIPWFDFSDSIFNNSPEEIDKALFKKYNISLDIIDHILDILPNYYNLDLTKYKQKGLITFDGKEYSKCEDITSYSNNELLMEFFNKVRPDKLQDNIHIHILREPRAKGFPSCPIENKPNLNLYIYALNSLRGHKGTNDFYTIISNQEKEIKKRAGLYKDIKNIIINVDDKKGHYYTKSILEYYIPFNSIEELRNFLNYICTDFVRICLYLIKTNMHLDAGELKYIPWFDFTDPVFSKSPSEIDDYLFKKYSISDEIRKHIEEILPDYYNIRKGREYAEYCRKKKEINKENSENEI